jgi:PAS domain S-box-containing protein
MPLIMILDDRATNRNIYARLATLIRDGVAVEAFGEAHDALEWFEHNPVDLVITDYKMPQMDGAEFTRRLRSTPRGADVPVLVITAYDDRDFRMRAFEAGATDFLQSPVDHFEFVARARNLLALNRRPGRGAAAGAAAHPAEWGPADAGGGEDSLRGSPDALARVIDAVPAMVSVAGRDGRCLFANAGQAAMAGAASPAELVGGDAARLFDAERAERSRSGDRLVFETGDALPPYQEEAPGPDGARRVLLTAKTPLRDATGAVVGVLTTSFDVTDQVQQRRQRALLRVV